VVLVWCGCGVGVVRAGLGEGCHLWATVHVTYTLSAKKHSLAKEINVSSVYCPRVGTWKYKYTKGSRPSVDGFSRYFQRFLEKLSDQDQTVFFRQVNPFRRHAAFCEAGSEAKMTVLNLPPMPFPEITNHKYPTNITNGC